MPDTQPLSRVTGRRFAAAVAALARSEVRRRAWTLFAALVVLLLAINALNVVNSYVGRDFMTAIERRDRAEFVRQAFRYVAVFAVSTLLAVMFRFAEESLGLVWRDWLTRRLVAFYLRQRVYFRLESDARLENPDQRIAEDVRTFVTSTISLFLMLANGTVTVLAFSGVLWSISPPLFVVGVVYAAAGSFLTIRFGRPLVRLNYDRADREAELRTELLHVRNHAEPVALQAREPQLEARLRRRIDALVGNVRRTIEVNRNLGFFVTGYNYMIQVIPALIVAPLFIRGQVEFGVIGQAAMAFSHLLGAFSLIVTQFQAISSYAAVLARLGALAEAMEQAGTAAPATGIEMVEAADGSLAYEHVTLRTRRDGRTLVRDLTLAIPAGTDVLVQADDDAVRIALLRATAGMWEGGEGRIARPPPSGIAFVPERPYVPPGTLREALTPIGAPPVTDERLSAALRAVDVETIVARVGGPDVQCDWRVALSLPEQQLVSLAAVVVATPRFVVLDRLGTALDATQVGRVLAALRERGVTYVAMSDEAAAAGRYDAVLRIEAGGAWRYGAGDRRDAGVA